MGVLDDAIREHLELRRKHGAPEEELRRQEQEALGPVGREPAPEPEEEIVSEGDEPAEAAEWAPEESPEATLEESTEAAHGAPSGAAPDEAPADADGPQSPGAVASAPVDLNAYPTDVDSRADAQEPFAEEAAPAIPRDVEAAEPLPDAEPPAEVEEQVPDPVEEQPGQASDYSPEERDREGAASAFAEPGPADPGHGFEEGELEEPHHEAAGSGFAQVDPDEWDSDARASGFESVEPEERDQDAAAAAEAEPDEGDAQRSGGRLEETPDFAEDSPEHHRLWFEQRRPRDYDFD